MRLLSAKVIHILTRLSLMDRSSGWHAYCIQQLTCHLRKTKKGQNSVPFCKASSLYWRSDRSSFDTIRSTPLRWSSAPLPFPQAWKPKPPKQLCLLSLLSSFSKERAHSSGVTNVRHWLKPSWLPLPSIHPGSRKTKIRHVIVFFAILQNALTLIHRIQPLIFFIYLSLMDRS